MNYPFPLRCFPGPFDSLVNFELDLYGLLFQVIGACLLILAILLFLGFMIAALIIRNRKYISIRKQKTWIIIKGAFMIGAFGIITLPFGLHNFPKELRKQLDDIALYYGIISLLIAGIYIFLLLKKRKDSATASPSPGI